MDKIRKCPKCGVKHGPTLEDISVQRLADVEYRSEQRIGWEKVFGREGI